MNIGYRVYHSLWKFADLMYPPVCAGCGNPDSRFCPDCIANSKIINSARCKYCGEPLSKNQFICNTCSQEKPRFERLCSWAEYEGVVRQAIHQLKYQRDLGLGEFFSLLLSELIKSQFDDIDLIVPIPLGKSRLRERGYNQAAIISFPIAQYLGITHAPGAVRRIKETGSQVKLAVEQRNLNLKGAFLGNPATLKNKSVLVIDDVITTGATMNHCAEALLDAGAVRVYGASIAKTVNRRHSINDTKDTIL